MIGGFTGEKMNNLDLESLQRPDIKDEPRFDPADILFKAPDKPDVKIEYYPITLNVFNTLNVYEKNTVYLVDRNVYETDSNGNIYKENGKLIPNNEYVLDGHKYYTDDNGKIYRVDGDLLPNSEYEINGYKYKTDEQGRIISAEGKLHLKSHEGRLTIKDSIETIGKGDQKEGDDRGHLIGDQFDGSNGLENMIPQNSDINEKDFRKFEGELAKCVKEGKEVYVKVEPVYEGDSRRPSAIVVTYSINGKESVRFFPNESEG